MRSWWFRCSLEEMTKTMFVCMLFSLAALGYLDVLPGTERTEVLGSVRCFGGETRWGCDVRISEGWGIELPMSIRRPRKSSAVTRGPEVLFAEFILFSAFGWPHPENWLDASPTFSRLDDIKIKPEAWVHRTRFGMWVRLVWSSSALNTWMELDRCHSFRLLSLFEFLLAKS